MPGNRVIRKLSDLTAEDCVRMDELQRTVGHKPAEFALRLFEQMRGNDRVSEAMGMVDTYAHSLQAATRAYRDGADEETVVVALLHDLFDMVAPENHDMVAAEFLRPYVSEDNYWIVRHHATFQLYYRQNDPGVDWNAREQFRNHPAFEKTIRFCERWDQVSFDPDYDTLPLSFFEPMVHRILAWPRVDRA